MRLTSHCHLHQTAARHLAFLVVLFSFLFVFFFTCLQHRLKKSAPSTCPTSDAHRCAQTPRIEPLTELHPSLTPQGVRMERGSRVNVSKTGPGPICTQQVWHLSVKTSHHGKAHPLCQSSSPRLRGKTEVSLFLFGELKCIFFPPPSDRAGPEAVARPGERSLFIQLVELTLFEPEEKTRGRRSRRQRRRREGRFSHMTVATLLTSAGDRRFK